MNFFKYIIELGKNVMAKDPAAKSLFVSIFMNPGVKAQSYHYLAHKLYNNGNYFLSTFLSHRARKITGIEIHPGAKLGRRILMDHGMGIVIGETAIVGDDVTIFHGVTLGGIGGEPNKKRHPTIGNGVLIGTGTSVLGNITIGDKSKIGANSVVLEDIPPYVTAVGSPARVVKKEKYAGLYVI
ncbi:MAG: serine O-acetyltransferase EpsC [Tissierellia bacterium]|nr:serine O-acetyltransferase EpsC [Tissierellia bacterium]